MDQHDVLASLSAEQRDRLIRKSDLHGLANLSLHWGGILALAWLIAARVPSWPFLMVVQGVLIAFLFTLLHETTHRTAFATRWINRGVARICGFMLVLSPEWFRYFHFAHHRHTQDPQRDPELAAPKPETLRQYLVHVSGIPVWRSQLGTLVRSALGTCNDPFVPGSARARIRSDSRTMLVAYAALTGASFAAGSAELLLVWVVPALLGQPVLRLYLMAEHGRCRQVANVFENTRTTFTTGAIRRLAWNMPFHAEHHAYPSVPFHRLPELHALTRPHLRVTAQGYVAFHRDYARTLGR